MPPSNLVGRRTLRELFPENRMLSNLRELLKRKVRTIRQALSDLLFPPRCAVCGVSIPSEVYPPAIEICEKCHQELNWTDWPVCLRCGAFTTVSGKDAPSCPWCQPLEYAFDRAICLGPYHEGLGPLILRLKRWPQPGLVKVLVRLLVSQRKPRLVFCLEADAVVAVPRHWISRLFGGLDPVAMIAEELARFLGLPFRPEAVRRIRLGKPQRALPLRDRFENARQLYDLGEGDFEGKHWVLVDDVITTGATASAIAELLKKAGAKEVTAVAIARAEGAGALPR